MLVISNEDKIPEFTLEYKRVNRFKADAFTCPGLENYNRDIDVFEVVLGGVVRMQYADIGYIGPLFKKPKRTMIVLHFTPEAFKEFLCLEEARSALDEHLRTWNLRLYMKLSGFLGTSVIVKDLAPEVMIRVSNDAMWMRTTIVAGGSEMIFANPWEMMPAIGHVFTEAKGDFDFCDADVMMNGKIYKGCMMILDGRAEIDHYGKSQGEKFLKILGKKCLMLGQVRDVLWWPAVDLGEAIEKFMAL